MSTKDLGYDPLMFGPHVPGATYGPGAKVTTGEGETAVLWEATRATAKAPGNVDSRDDWVRLTPRQGRHGKQGERGHRGMQGKPGEKGDAGEVGATGPEGPTGPAGRDGRDYEPPPDPDPFGVHRDEQVIGTRSVSRGSKAGDVVTKTVKRKARSFKRDTSTGEDVSVVETVEVPVDHVFDGAELREMVPVKAHPNGWRECRFIDLSSGKAIYYEDGEGPEARRLMQSRGIRHDDLISDHIGDATYRSGDVVGWPGRDHMELEKSSLKAPLRVYVEGFGWRVVARELEFVDPYAKENEGREPGAMEVWLFKDAPIGWGPVMFYEARGEQRRDARSGETIDGEVFVTCWAWDTQGR